jgi:hypothetical protein
LHSLCFGAHPIRWFLVLLVWKLYMYFGSFCCDWEATSLSDIRCSGYHCGWWVILACIRGIAEEWGDCHRCKWSVCRGFVGFKMSNQVYLLHLAMVLSMYAWHCLAQASLMKGTSITSLLCFGVTMKLHIGKWKLLQIWCHVNHNP